MTAILKRELSSYFNTAIGYVVLAIFFLFSGIFFYVTSIYAQNSSLAGTFSSMFIIVLLIAPIITMKSFSEEKRQKTDQALLTAPVNLFQIVMGKFLGAFILFAICVCIFIVYGVVISFFVTPMWSEILCTTFGLLLFGGALIAIDIFVSALTESQIISVVVGIGAGFGIYLLDSLASMISNETISSLILSLSFNSRYTNFTSGILNLGDIIFFLSVIAVFLFLTIRVFEKKRWG